VDANEFLARSSLDAEMLKAWIEAGWLRPQRYGGRVRFLEADLARAHLVRALQSDLGVNDEGVDVALDLIDKLYGVRRILRELISAFEAQPDEMRARFAAEIRSNGLERRTGSRSSHFASE
jgi:chaperone modulatory protein CbpM